MSEYINGYLRVSDDKFVPLFSYCRLSDFYRAAQYYAPYEKIRAITSSDLKEIREKLEESYKNYEDLIKRYQDEIDLILKMNNDAEDKIELINDHLNGIDDVKGEMKYIPYWIGRVNMLEDIIEENRKSQYSENPLSRDENDIIYFGIETGYVVTSEDIENARKG